MGLHSFDEKNKSSVVIINRENYPSLSFLVSLLAGLGAKQVIFRLPSEEDQLIKLTDLRATIREIHDKYEENLRIVLINFPICAFPDFWDHIFWGKGALYEKSNACMICRHNDYCGGVSKNYRDKFGLSELKSCPDIPREVMIEVEPRCNFNCKFCFNKLSFAKVGRDKIKPLSTEYLKEVIKKISEAGIPSIRFTGGEPLLRPDILEILKYAKSLNFSEVRLNTNASLIDQNMARRLVQFVDNFLIPLESAIAREEDEVCGSQDIFDKKIKAVGYLKEAGARIVRIGTVISKEVINDLQNMEKLIESLSVDWWELYRPIPFGRDASQLEENDIKTLAQKLSRLIGKRKKHYRIYHALPFCAISNLNLINGISDGAALDDGHTRFVIDPRGHAKPHYYIDENIGDPRDPLACWQHPFMKKMRNLEFLPKECKNCIFRKKCRGGSRASAKIISGSYSASDPLARFQNINH